MPNPFRNGMTVTALLAAHTICASAAQVRSDPICSEISALVSKTRTGSTHVVRFMIDWSEVSKTCRVVEGDLGHGICTALIEHGNPEYMAANVIRLVSCLDPGRKFPTPVPDQLPGSEENLSFTRNDGSAVSVSIKYDTSPADAFPWIIITVRGSGP